MKKILTFALSLLLIFVSSGCGNNTELEELKKENEALKQKLSDSSPMPSDTTGGVVALNIPYTVETVYGTYKLTIIDVVPHAFPSYGEEYANYAALLFEIENIDFKNDDFAGVTFDLSSFAVYDDKDYQVEISAGFDYEDYKYPETVLPGKKVRGVYMLDLKPDTKYVDVMFVRGSSNEPTFELRVNLDE